MISFDTNLLLYSLNRDCPEHQAARDFFASLPNTARSVAVCELVLVELYVLLRNPAVLNRPLDAADAAALVQTFRRHPAWVLIDYPGGNPALTQEIWRYAAQPGVGRRIIFDARLALTLRHHGVTDFATRNETHFSSFGFTRLWNPLPH